MTVLTSPNDLLYFIELTNTLNFSRASERIGISQPSLSAAIKRLENAVGTELFNRSKTGATLTHAGKRLLLHSKTLLQFWDTIKSECLASHSEIQGAFTLGSHPSVALAYLSGFLPQLLFKYPKLEVNLKHDLSRKILEGIINLSIDLGLVVNPIKHPDLIIHKLMNDEVTFWHHPNLKNNIDILICDPDLMQTQWLIKRIQRQGIKYRRIITSSSLEVIANLTVSGAGIGILPGSIALLPCNAVLKPIAKMPVYQDEICLVYRHENRNIKAIQIIINAIKSYFTTNSD